MTETGFVEPGRAATTALVEQLLRDAGAPTDPTTWQWVRTGSSSLVVLSGEVAVRVARDDDAAADLRRGRDLMGALPPLPFDVPRPVGAVAVHEGVVAAAATRVHGEPRPAGPADPTALRGLLETIHGLDPMPLRAHLAPARAFYGGPDWYAVLTERVVPMLPERLRDQARAAADALAGLDHPGTVVTHGDLAGSNVHWQGDRVVGVLDWDLAALDDPAEDVASLLGWHGWQLGHLVTDDATLARARAFRAVGPLAVLAFAVLRERPEAEVRRVTARAVARLDRG
jgi:aminoglycoside phosphotransferase (APT) family kinase protein